MDATLSVDRWRSGSEATLLSNTVRTPWEYCCQIAGGQQPVYTAPAGLQRPFSSTPVLPERSHAAVLRAAGIRQRAPVRYSGSAEHCRGRQQTKLAIYCSNNVLLHIASNLLITMVTSKAAACNSAQCMVICLTRTQMIQGYAA